MATQPVSGPKPKRRRLLKAGVAMIAAGVIVLAFLPTIMGLKPIRGWLVARVNARIAPGSIELEGLTASWNDGIELTDFRLSGPEKARVFSAHRVVINRGLLGLLMKRSDLGTVTIEDADVNIERRPDGSINVLEALGIRHQPEHAGPVAPPPANDTPQPADKTSLVVVIKESKLRLDSPELGEPLTAKAVEATLTIVPGKPAEAVATLADGDRSIGIHAKLDRAEGGDLAVTVVGKAWPISVKQAGAVVRGRFDGTIAASRVVGHWTVKGDSAFSGFDAAGPSLAGDHLKLAKVTLAADIGQAAGGWTIRRLELASPVANLTASGTWPAATGVPATLRGSADLAAIARMLPHAMRIKDGLTIDRGMANLRMEVSETAGTDRIDVSATIDGLQVTEAGHAVPVSAPPSLTAQATRTRDKVSVESVEIKASGVDIKASGDLDVGVKLTGTIDLPAVRAQLAELIDLGAIDFKGHARLAADYRRAGETYRARFAADCRDLDLTGATAAPIHRDLARLDVWATGSRKPDGSPLDCKGARLELTAGDVHAVLDAATKEGAASISGDLEADHSKAKLALRWKDRTFRVDDLRLDLVPPGSPDATNALRLAMTGVVDLKTGTAAFLPITGVDPGAVGLGADGLNVSGLGVASVPLNVQASLVGDAAALDRLVAAWMASTPKGLAPGLWSGKIKASKAPNGEVDVDAAVNIADLFATGPAKVAVLGSYRPDMDRMDFEGVDVTCGYGKTSIKGQLLEPSTRKFLSLKGTIEPRWDIINPMIVKATEPNAKFQATVHPFQLGGSLRADSTPILLSQIEGTFGLDLESLEAYGVKVAPTPIVLRLGGGSAKFDPIKTTVNDGPAMLLPNLAFDESYGVWFRLAAGSRIDGMAINDAVSDAVFAFVAPVLKQASQVSGKVSVGLAGASFPLTGSGSTRVEGHIVFENVLFSPGPLGKQLASITGQTAPSMTLHEPIQLQIADGRVNQTGMTIPIPGGPNVAFDGSVGFDKSLVAKATVPITPGMLGSDKRLQKLVDGTKLAIPIGGTLSKPILDRRAFEVALRDVGKTMVERGFKDEAAGFLDKAVGTKGSGGDVLNGLLDGLGGKKKP